MMTLHDLRSVKSTQYQYLINFKRSNFTPLDIIVGGLIFYQCFFFFSSSFFSPSNLRARSTELNEYRPHGKYEGSPTLSENFLNFGPQTVKTGSEFLPTPTISFCPSPSHTLYAALTWRPTATLNDTVLGSSAAQI